MENLPRALHEEMGIRIQRNSAKKCFNKVYRFMLYQDTEALFKTLDYRNTLKQEQKPRERYYVFRYMLRLIKDRHPLKFKTLCL